MKKSEAAKRLDQWIMDNEKTLISVPNEADRCALAIDFLVNELGMLPPSVPILKVFDSVVRAKNEWEPEDEA